MYRLRALRQAIIDTEAEAHAARERGGSASHEQRVTATVGRARVVGIVDVMDALGFG